MNTPLTPTNEVVKSPLSREEITQRRRALGWTQNGLARRIHKSPSFISRLLRGQSVSGPTMLSIKKVLENAERRRLEQMAKGWDARLAR